VSKKSIVFINQSSGYLMIDIIHQHLHKYDELVLLTGFLNPRNIPLDKSVKVHMLKSYNRNSTFLRLYSWIMFTVQSWWLLLVKYRKAALYCISNPPFTILLGLLLRRPTTFLIYDVYPDALVSTKLLREDHFLIKIWNNWNKRAYSRAKNIFTISTGMKKLLSKYIQEAKIEIVPIWTDNSFLKPIPKSENKLINEWGLKDKFVVMYSGNLGLTHPVEVLIDLANELPLHRVEFVIVGEGAKKEKLQRLIEKYELVNVQLLPYQPTELLPLSLNVADLAVVTISNEAGQLSVPSKTFNLMSCGKPIMAIAPLSSELAQLLYTFKNGECFDLSQIEQMKELILTMVVDKSNVAQYKKKSLLASKEFTPKNAKRLYFEVV